MEQEIKVSAKAIMVKLSRLQDDMNYIREHVGDVILTDDDLKAIDEGRKDLEEGKTRRL